MSFPFATTDLKLSTVLTAYGITNGSMNSLRGVTVYNSNGTTIVAPQTGNFPLLQTFGGRFSLNPVLFTVTISSTGNVTIPSPATGRPPPVAFFLTLAGGGGGGGGAGGDYKTNILGIDVFRAGGQGCGGGGGAYLQTTRIPYTSGNNITVNSIPTGGNGGQGGFGGNDTSDGSGGSSGVSASVTYQGQTFIATGGSGGNPGFKGQSGGGGSDANQPVAGGSFSGTNISDSSNGSVGVVRTGGTSGGGRVIGKGGDGGQGGSGSPGTSGTILISWYFF